MLSVGDTPKHIENQNAGARLENQQVRHGATPGAKCPPPLVAPGDKAGGATQLRIPEGATAHAENTSKEVKQRRKQMGNLDKRSSKEAKQKQLANTSTSTHHASSFCNGCLIYGGPKSTHGGTKIGRTGQDPSCPATTKKPLGIPLTFAGSGRKVHVALNLPGPLQAVNRYGHQNVKRPARGNATLVASWTSFTKRWLGAP